MRRLSLDYQKSAGPSRLPGIVLLALGLAAGIWTGASYYRIAAQLAARQAQLGASTHASFREAAGEAGGKADRRTLEEIGEANRVLDELRLPWGSLFHAVETASTERVALLSLRPDTRHNVVVIAAESKDKADMLDYVKQLQHSPGLSEVYLQSHEVQTQDAGRPVRFSVRATFSVKP